MPNNSAQCILGIFCISQYAAYAEYVIQYAAVYQEICNNMHNNMPNNSAQWIFCIFSVIVLHRFLYITAYSAYSAYFLSYSCIFSCKFLHIFLHILFLFLHIFLHIALQCKRRQKAEFNQIRSTQLISAQPAATWTGAPLLCAVKVRSW